MAAFEGEDTGVSEGFYHDEYFFQAGIVRRKIIDNVSGVGLLEASVCSINSGCDDCTGRILVREILMWWRSWDCAIAPDWYPYFDMLDVRHELWALFEEIRYFA